MFIKKNISKLYYLLTLPFIAVGSYVSVICVLLFVCSTMIYAVSFEVFINLLDIGHDSKAIEKIVNWKPQNNSLIYDSQGNIISEQFSEYHQYVTFKNIPKNMINAIVSIEDRNFFEHSGIDLLAIFRALIFHVKKYDGYYRQGASTITQQVVRNILLSKEKTITRKLKEIILAIELETKLSKEKIMEIYCNQMFLGNGAYGVAAAAKRYFGKELVNIDTQEAALLAGLFQLPSFYNPARHPERAKKRQVQVLKAMNQAGYVNDLDYQSLLNKKLDYVVYESLHGNKAPFFVDYVVEKANKILEDLEYKIKDSGLKIYTTLNQRLQTLAEESFKESKVMFNFARTHMIDDSLVGHSKDSPVEAAMLVIDHRKGEVVSMIGGRDYKRSQFNRAASGIRAPGSVFKSIIYSYALNKGKKWNDLHYVGPITVGNYRPHTSGSDIMTETTMLRAFYKSINSTAVDIGVKLGVGRILNYAKVLGVETELKPEAATLLGGSEVSLMDMGRVYSTFANRGTKVKPIVIKKITDKEGHIIYEAENLVEREIRVLSRRKSQLIIEGLKKVVQSGTAYNARYLSGHVAGKTGTSNQSKDNWFAGFTNDLTIITWVGNDDQKAFKGNITSANTAVPLWAKFAKKSIEELRTTQISRSNLLRRVTVHPKYGTWDGNGISMYFVPGTEPINNAKSDLLLLAEGEKLRAGLE